MAEMNAAERFALIKENLQEILNPDIIEGILAEGRNPKIYWGTSPTGKPHCGYFGTTSLQCNRKPTANPAFSARRQNRTVSGCRL
jgi:hypothetical protein